MTKAYLISQLSESASSKNGGENDLQQRLTALEATFKAELKYLATKEDVQRLETRIAQQEAFLQRWLIGLFVGVAFGFVSVIIGIAMLVTRTFF